MSKRPSTEDNASVSTGSQIYQTPDHLPYTTHYMFSHASEASRPEPLTRHQLFKIFRRCETPPMPLVPEPNLIDINLSTEEEVGEIHSAECDDYTECGRHSFHLFCSTMYLCFSYYPRAKHNSRETAAFRFEYRVRNHRGQYQRATGPQLQKCDWLPGCEPSPTLPDTLVESLNLGTALRDFNRDLALWVAHDITAQVHKNGGYFSHPEHSDNNHGDKPSSVFANVGHEVERYHGLWKELKDDIAHALFTEHKTYFDSRDVGVFN